MAGKGMREKMRMVQQLQSGMAANPDGQLTRKKQSAGKRLSNEEKAKLKKQREKEMRKRKRESRGDRNNPRG
jgi:signal recognition particle subunit SRP54